tara:strand:+ start:23 stop:667 length:645 start_codon:yes stop_codon:yes gene_type:complete
MILNIFKPPGPTSFSIVKSIRKITGEKKVGHGGTLDPFAEGVLIIGTGRDTKKLGKISDSDKTYCATLTLGSMTDTHDPEGKIIKTKEVPRFKEKALLETLSTFLGKTLQVPPMYSAKRINGQRLYKLARKNISVKRQPIAINIKEIKLIDYDAKQIMFDVKCSKGTYVRVLGKNIAEKIGTVGHLSQLVRTKVGSYMIEESQTVEVFNESWKS